MNILIVEDEFIIAESLSTTLKRLDYIVLAICSNYKEAEQFLSHTVPDVVILDIKLQGEKSGIDLAELINKSYQIPFIFLTSITDKHLLTTLKYLNPSGILIKPFNKHELHATLSLAKHQYEQRQLKLNKPEALKDHVFIKQKSEHVRLQFTDILYLKSSDVYINIKTKDNITYKFRGTLDAFNLKLNQEFIRVHRSFIVNTNCIDKVYKEHLLINSDIIPIGNTYKTDVFNLLKLN